MTVAYIKYNDSRKPEYQLVTSIGERDGGRYSLKQAASAAAGDFLDSLFAKHESLAAPGFPLRPLEPQADEGGVRFAFLAGVSLDYQAGRAVAARDQEGLLAVFRAYGELIDRIPTVEAPTAEDGFSEFFGDADAAAGMEHLATGCLDLILENIYLLDGEYVLIDYEWTFDFPLPKALILLRTVMNTYYKYHAGGINLMLPVDDLYAGLGIDPAAVEALMRMEWSFQNAVNDRVQPYEDFTALYGRVLREPYDDSLTLTGFRDRLAQVEAELGHARQMVHDRDDEIASMRASKFWKLRTLYGGLARRLPVKVKRRDGGTG
ncbi:MAG: hypothetical protein ACYC5A_11130 [Thermoleophilia bacterium]